MQSLSGAANRSRRLGVEAVSEFPGVRLTAPDQAGQGRREAK
jgi:hypothetical protein